MKSLFIAQKTETIVVDVQNIAYVLASGNYSEIFQLENHKPLLCCKRLLEIEEMLLGSTFYRINRNTLINMDLVSKIKSQGGKISILLKGSETFSVSRRRLGELKLKLRHCHSQI